MARHVKADGTITFVEPKNGTDFSLEELQGFVGGHIELLFLPKGSEVMVLNEEGKIYNLPLNGFATKIAYQPIVGDVLICREEQIK